MNSPAPVHRANIEKCDFSTDWAGRKSVPLRSMSLVRALLKDLRGGRARPLIIYASNTSLRKAWGRRNMKAFGVGFIVLACGLVSACGDKGVSGRVVDYNWDVRPILSDTCFRCHGPSKDRKAGLRLDLAETAIAELPESPGKHAIVPGNLASSEMIRRITSDDPDVKMPPPDSRLSLSKDQIDVLTAWIKQGAEYKKHWAFIPPEESPAPKSKFDAQAVNDIDKFVFSRLEKEGLSPSREADKATLINRVSLTLTGLPPTPAEVDAFVADTSPNAYEHLVDRLLAAPAYGERMATEWLDAARFADSDGYLDDGYNRLLYPWRDWVIKAFNENLPYDKFGRWQLDGDLLDHPTKDQVLATTFGRLHRRTAENGIIDEEYRVEYVLDRTDTLGTAFLGLSVGCARCHDHKFDPISQADYYSLTGFFNSIDDSGYYPLLKWDVGPTMLMTDEATDRRIADLKAKIAELDAAYSDTLKRSRTEVAQQAATLVSDNSRRAAAAALDSSLEHSQTAYYPFETLDEHPERVAAYLKSPSLAPSEPLKFSPSGTKGLKPAVLQTPILKKGIKGQALFFDANNKGFLDRDEKIGRYDHPDEFSVDWWVYTADKVYDEAAVINHNDHLRYGSGGWSVDLDANRVKITLAHAYPLEQIVVLSEQPLPTSAWTHVAFSYDGSARASGVKLYLNGKPVPLQVVRDHLTQSMLPTGAPFFADMFDGLAFGKRWQQSPLLNGGIDELRVFGRALSPLEVAYLHDGSKALQSSDVNTELVDHLARLTTVAGKAKTALTESRRELNDLLTGLKQVMVMGDTDHARPTYVLKRGLYSNHDVEVQPKALPQIFPYPDDLPKNRSGLAAWLFDPRNPLTARVYVNRLWQAQFGKGLVTTAEDFGSQGTRPSHPQLLDWLAVKFVESGWDIKALNKFIVMSATYRQSSVPTDDATTKDPENVLLASWPSRRMSAEMIRDNALVVSGLLDPKVGGPSVFPYQPDGVWESVSFYAKYPNPAEHPEDQHRRSLYTLIRRNAPAPSMSIFDFPRRHMSVARRATSSTPLQPLVLLNDTQYVEASRALAQRAMLEHPDNIHEQIDRMFRLVTRRLPEEAEAQVLERYYDSQRAAFASSPQDAAKFLHIGVVPPNEGLDAAALAAGAETANVIFNTPDAYTVN